MSPLSRMRKSRDAWKIKNAIKRKQMNKLKRVMLSQAVQIQGKDHEIQRLSELVVAKTVACALETSPDIEEIRRRLKDLEEETRCQFK